MLFVFDFVLNFTDVLPISSSIFSLMFCSSPLLVNVKRILPFVTSFFISANVVSSSDSEPTSELLVFVVVFIEILTLVVESLLPGKSGFSGRKGVSGVLGVSGVPLSEEVLFPIFDSGLDSPKD